jgi:hypothetical protein
LASFTFPWSSRNTANRLAKHQPAAELPQPAKLLLRKSTHEQQLLLLHALTAWFRAFSSAASASISSRTMRSSSVSSLAGCGSAQHQGWCTGLCTTV